MNENRAPAPKLNWVTGTRAGAAWDVAVVIPAKNEAPRIQNCLMALADAIDRTAANVGIILCVSDTDDDTAKLGATILQMRQISHLVLDMRFAAGCGGVGRVRDLGCKLSQRVAGFPAILMTTDADSCVAPDWISANLEALQAVDIVFGTVIPDPEQLSSFDPHMARHEFVENTYAEIALRVVSALDPLPHDPAPAHQSPSGASMAMTVAALNRLEGIPWCRSNADRALAARAEALDLRIRYASGPKVVTSCRLNGSADGRRANAMRERCGEGDPLCDPWLEPAETMVTRYHAKGQLRAVWPDVATLWTTAQELLGEGPMPDPAAHDTFGAFWQELAETHPALKRRRLRNSDVLRELPVLQEYLDQIAKKHADPPCLSGRFTQAH